jgi:predicted NBD/HSP70 family sugar kinase
LANDGQCAVTAEWRFGEVARRLTNFVYVYVGMGLGSGVMIQGAAFGGASGNAGEFGHTTVVPGGHGCICGKNGCLETYLSVDSAMRHLAARGIEVDTMAAFEERFDAAHPTVAAWIGEGIEPLRIGLNTIENLFDPQTIMLGGTAPAWLIDALVEGVQPLYPSVGRHNREIPRLIRAELGRDSVARGAAVLPVLSRLNPQYQQLNPFG